MKFNRNDLRWAAEKGIISLEQGKALEQALTAKYEDKPNFSLGHVIYYFGALLIISAMSWFMVRAWETLGGGGIFAASLCYAALFYILGAKFWEKPGLKIPGGLLFTAGVWMTPLAVYGLQRWGGWWLQGDPGIYRDVHIWIKGGWFFMEVATIVVGLITLYFVRFPFLTFPIAFALWYMSMDITPLITGNPQFPWEARKMVSLIFGLVMLLLTYGIDRRTKEDYGFWGYLFGMMAFWGGLSMMDSNSELSKFAYCMINVFLVFLSVFLSRKVFIVFGSIGVFIYLGHLAHKVFADSLLFPVVLSSLGLAVIFLGVLYQKNRQRFEAWLIASLPEEVKRLRPTER